MTSSGAKPARGVVGDAATEALSKAANALAIPLAPLLTRKASNSSWTSPGCAPVPSSMLHSTQAPAGQLHSCPPTTAGVPLSTEAPAHAAGGGLPRRSGGLGAAFVGVLVRSAQGFRATSPLWTFGATGGEERPRRLAKPSFCRAPATTAVDTSSSCAGRESDAGLDEDTSSAFAMSSSALFPGPAGTSAVAPAPAAAFRRRTSTASWLEGT
mmetsp:Transcript_83440/g.232733  ORF Transcript_83440/g.232733 Transcript_83440/m.232733 type:complete len:212 (-) Transcript_83440:638-1273(-)